MKIIFVSPKNRTVYNFRGDLIKEIVALGHEVIVTGPNNIDVDKIEALGARFVEIPMEKTGVNAKSDLKYIFALKKLFKNEKPDITFGYTIKPVVYGAIAAKMAKVQNRYSMVEGLGYIFTANTRKARILRPIVKTLYRIGFMCAKKVIFINPDDRKDFLKMKLLKETKCRLVNGAGVNLEHFKPEPLPQEPVFFMLSRALISKGVRVYLEATEIIRKKYPDVRMMLLGEIDESMQDSLKKEEVQKYVDMGTVEYFPEHPDVRLFYKQCSVYVLPSYREGVPRTTMEAMAMGRPVITTDAPGCRETVADGETGFFVPTGDSKALADAMEKFIKNPSLIATMGEASYNFCKEKFDVRKINKDMMNYLEII